MEIITISVFTVCGLIFLIYLGEHNKLFAQGLLLLIVLIIMILSAERITELLSVVDMIKDLLNGQEVYVEMLIKMTGIIIVAEFTSDLCEQEGYKALGKQVLMFGRLAVVMVGYPMVLEFVEMMRSFLT